MSNSKTHSSADCNDLDGFMKGLIQRNPDQKEFHQAVHEVAEDLLPYIAEREHYQGRMLLERMTEPDRIVAFRVCWTDDQGRTRVNRAWRVQFSNVTGPYKGGLRFDKSVTESVLKFLGFEQCFKNALTGLPMGGAKGGANFNPKGKSEGEIMRFCQALMASLYPFIGEHRDVPAGDMGVGTREIGYLFGEYRRLTQQFVGAITGKGVTFGGSELRVEATGYGVIHFVHHMLERRGEALEGKRVAISGAGNVALHAAQKAMQDGARVVTLSDSGGFVHFPNGMESEQLDCISHIKHDLDGSLAEAIEKIGGDYYPDKKPWHVPCDIALPCALQNELNESDARALCDNDCMIVAEGANMPCQSSAIRCFERSESTVFAPGKAVNAGGVAVSGLERAQNAQHILWSRDRVHEELTQIMASIHTRCVDYGSDGNDEHVNYRKGANIGGFVKLADAMIAQGVV